MELRGTTILAVRNERGVALGGDGQVTMGQSMVMKHTARKVRRLYRGQVLAGFAGATADAFTLFERFEAKLEESGGNLLRAAVEMAKEGTGEIVLAHLSRENNTPARALDTVQRALEAAGLSPRLSVAPRKETSTCYEVEAGLCRK